MEENYDNKVDEESSDGILFKIWSSSYLTHNYAYDTKTYFKYKYLFALYNPYLFLFYFYLTTLLY